MDTKQLLTIVKTLPNYLILTGSSVQHKIKKYNDIDFLSFKPLKEVIQDIIIIYPNLEIVRNGNLYIDLIINGIHINVWKVNKNNYLFMKLSHDYSKYFVINMRKKAYELGYKLNPYGLYKIVNGKEKEVRINNIQELFNLLEIKFRDP
jgi:DNA polymerase/3'-5' exonuclease PolX